ncbi:MAG: conjugative transposon protein TraN [Chitinophagaceae bacterium]|nr:MAG: conjugative transposon protein TraN [Chitinophagaceae bacterium]
MKQFVCLVCALGFVVSCLAQTPLCITTSKTTSLIFPFPVKHVDRGTKDVLVQQVKEAENILLVKAASVDFPETNLSVITGDGSLYSFSVCYLPNPPLWVYQMPVQKSASIASYAASILDNPKTIRVGLDKKGGVEGEVTGIYIKNGVIYYQFSFFNHTPIDYDLAFLRYYIRDKKQPKRTAIQEVELIPQHVAGNTSRINASSSSTVVVALEKFTIPDEKYFAIEMGEKNGGRHLILKLSNKNIIQAIPLPDVK